VPDLRAYAREAAGRDGGARPRISAPALAKARSKANRDLSVPSLDDEKRLHCSRTRIIGGGVSYAVPT
jgi:hypothetical protein